MPFRRPPRPRSRRRRASLVVLLALLLGSAVAPPEARISTGVVISEFRVRGPNGAADEFIELYNLSATPVDIGGWTIAGSNNAGTTSIRVTINAGTILNPGCHFLATNSSASGGPYSGAVPGNQTYAIGITDDGGIGLRNTANEIIDQVGMSAGSAFKEGTPLTSLGTSNQDRGYERRPGGASGSGTDTDDNSADFQLRAPSDPQNLSSTCVVIGSSPPTGVGTATPNPSQPGATSLLTVAVTPGTPLSPIISVTGNLTLIGGAAAQLFFDDGTNGDAVPGNNVYSYLATIGLSTTAGTKSLPVAILDAAARTGTTTISLTVNVPTPFYAIHDIQGPGPQSPLELGQAVRTQGVVTARRANNGFFIQTPDSLVDGSSTTSEGIFVFTGGPPPATAAVSSFVEVVGTVTEFAGDTGSPTVTELTSPTVSVLAASHPMPIAVTIGASDTNPAGGLHLLERLEGMRVHVAALHVVGPTGGAIDEANAIGNSNGVFYGVLPGIARPFREPGVQLPDALPPASPANVPRFDANPERVRVDSDGQIGNDGVTRGTRLEVTSGAFVTNVIGVLDYAFRTYTILPDLAPTPDVTGNTAVVPVRPAAAGEFTVATANVFRFYDTVNDPGGDIPLTPAAFQNRLNKLSLQVREVLHLPDIIGFQEIEKLSVLEAIAAKINADAGAAEPAYVPFLAEGNDPSAIDVGFLVKSSRVAIVDVTQVGKEERFDGNMVVHDRPPLILRAIVHGGVGDALPVTVIVNHLRSLLGVNDPEEPVSSDRARRKRRLQAEFVANLVQSIQQADPAARIVVVGDLNAFEFSDGLVDSVGTLIGAPAPADQVVLASPDLVNPNLVPLSGAMPASERYSFVFDGNAQVLDHILISTTLTLTGVQVARVNADFPESARNDAGRPERLSDHDPVVAYFEGCALDVSAGISVTRSGFQLNRATGRFLQQVTVRNTSATDVTGPVSVAVDGLSSHATLVTATGTTLCKTPAGVPFVEVPVGDGVLSPGETATVVLQFTTSAPGTISYQTRVLSGSHR